MKALKSLLKAMVLVVATGCGKMGTPLQKGVMPEIPYVDYKALKKSLLENAPDDSYLMRVIAYEKSKSYSPEEVLSYMKIRTELKVETPVLLGISLLDGFVPPQENTYEKNPPPCGSEICGDIYYAYFYAEFPNGIFDPQNIMEGILVLRYRYNKNEGKWELDSYRFVDSVKVTSSISLKAVNGITMEPVEGAKAYGKFGKGYTSLLAKTNGEGKATIYGVIAGDVEVRVFGGSFEEAIIKIRTEAGKTTDIGVVTLLPQAYPVATVKGRLFFKDGTPVSPFFFGDKEVLPIVYLTSQNDTPSLIPPAPVNADGSFEIEYVSGNYEFRVHIQNLERILTYGNQFVNSDHIDVSIPCVASSGPVVIELEDIYVDNTPPKILALTSEKTVVSPGARIKITASVEDEDHDVLTYLWSSTGGEITISASSSIFWTAPQETGTYRIFLHINDRKGGIARSSISIGVANLREVEWQEEVSLTTPDRRWSVTSYLYGYGPSNNISVDLFGVVHMVWSDYRDGNFEIYYRYVEEDYMSPEFRITGDSDISTAPSVAGDLYSTANIVWTSLVNDTEPKAMFARVSFGYILSIQPLSNYRSYSPSVAVDDYGRTHIVWVDERNGNPEIYYAMVEDEMIGEPVRVSNDESVSDYPAIAVDRNGTVYIVWADGRDGNWEIYGRSFDGTGWSEEIRITNGPSSSIWPRIAIDSANRLHLLWTDWRGYGDFPKVYYKFCDPSSWICGEDTLLSPPSSGAWGGAIAVDEKDTLHVVWTDERGIDRDLFYRNGDGKGVWGEEVRLTDSPGDSYAPSIAIIPGYSIAIMFTDTRNGYYPEVYGKLGKFLDSEGFVN